MGYLLSLPFFLLKRQKYNIPAMAAMTTILPMAIPAIAPPLSLLGPGTMAGAVVVDPGADVPVDVDASAAQNVLLATPLESTATRSTAEVGLASQSVNSFVSWLTMRYAALRNCRPSCTKSPALTCWIALSTSSGVLELAIRAPVVSFTVRFGTMS